jgi:glycosyltransferase involved in cell wall biosynthesis
MVAPPWYAVPPDGYGGIELEVHLLTRELRRLGHHVTLFAREGSTGADRVVELAPAAWSDEMGTWVHKLTYLHRVHCTLRGGQFDLLHDHNGPEGMLIASLIGDLPPAVVTVHEPVAAAEAALLQEVDERIDLVAVSASQRAGAPGVRWAAAIHNAAEAPYDLRGAADGGYLVAMARIHPTKGQHLAIEVARRSGLPLVLAGKVDPLPECRDYFLREIEPALGRGVTWLPEVRGRAKWELLAGARAMVCPLCWEEPFGIAMAEAMVAGTPVVAFPRGAAAELIEPGVTGLLADDPEGLARAVAGVAAIPRRRCADLARERFAPARMAAAYERVYRFAGARDRRSGASAEEVD